MGGIGFFLSRMLGAKFEELRTATERIREGDLRVEIGHRTSRVVLEEAPAEEPVHAERALRRTREKAHVTIFCARPGLIIGRRGVEVASSMFFGFL